MDKNSTHFIASMNTNAFESSSIYITIEEYFYIAYMHDHIVDGAIVFIDNWYFVAYQSL